MVMLYQKLSWSLFIDVWPQSNFLHVNYVGENLPTRANRPPTPGISPKWVNRLFFVNLWPVDGIVHNGVGTNFGVGVEEARPEGPRAQGRINQCSNMFGRTGAPTL